MTRNELIIAFQPIIDNIVKKYNNHKSDVDLQSIGNIKCIKAVDRCLEEGVTEFDAIRPRVIVWVKNAILNALKVEKNINQTDDIDDYAIIDDSEFNILKYDIRESLTGKARQVYDMKLEQATADEICTALNIKKTQYYVYLKKIKNLICGQNQD